MVFKHKKLFLLFGWIILLSSCKTWYINEVGEVRPKKQEFIVKPDSLYLSIFDTIPFIVKEVFACQFENFDCSILEQIIVFSVDKRVCSYIDTSKFIGTKLVILNNLWHESPSVGYFEKQNDTIVFEYYLHQGLGKYVEKH